jgi:hypothetical protein
LASVIAFYLRGFFRKSCGKDFPQKSFPQNKKSVEKQKKRDERFHPVW